MRTSLTISAAFFSVASSSLQVLLVGGAADLQTIDADRTGSRAGSRSELVERRASATCRCAIPSSQVVVRALPLNDAAPLNTAIFVSITMWVLACGSFKFFVANAQSRDLCDL